MKTIEVTLGNKNVPFQYGCRADNKLPTVCFNAVDNRIYGEGDGLINIPPENNICINFLTAESLYNMMSELTRLYNYMVELEAYNDAMKQLRIENEI